MSNAICCPSTPAVSSHSVSAHSGPHNDVTARRLKTKQKGQLPQRERHANYFDFDVDNGPGSVFEFHGNQTHGSG